MRQARLLIFIGGVVLPFIAGLLNSSLNSILAKLRGQLSTICRSAASRHRIGFIFLPVENLVFVLIGWLVGRHFDSEMSLG
ncbi:MAG TPA: hypothetical protein VGM43_25255 [Bryobacteraceae bacterium]